MLDEIRSWKKVRKKRNEKLFQKVHRYNGRVIVASNKYLKEKIIPRRRGVTKFVI